MKVIIRVDAAYGDGLGHLMRCLVLTEYWRSLGANCQFFTKNPSDQAIIFLKDYDWYDVALDGDYSWRNIEADIFLVDSYHLLVGRDDVASFLVLLDDWPHREIDADILIDQNPIRTTEEYKNFVSKRTRMLLGNNYLLLRKEFYNQRFSYVGLAHKKLNVLIYLGGSDSSGYTFEIAKMLFSDFSQYLGEVTALVSRSSPSWDRLKSLPVKRVEFCDCMANLYRQFDVCFGAAGSSAWERATSGLASAIYVMAENQKDVAAYCENSGIAMVAGDLTRGPLHNRRKISGFLTDASYRSSIVEEGAKLLKNRADLEVTKRILVSDSSSISLEEFVMADAPYLYRMQCEPGLRKFFKNKRIPTWRGHYNWLLKYIANDRCSGYIIKLYGIKVGYVRVDSGMEDEISIAISKRYLGLGLGKLAIKIVQSEYKGNAVSKALVAVVAKGNMASRRLFLACGFKKVSGDKYVWK